ncbi:hypothetical protein O181_010098 [Austropuccinia psidii MF-1]|uniref:Uncharacterized protein n=1 Tax=Austropuccinia psidii MF-1 TaxID=1389203 RepID=A0A9Q3BSN6_9BASI|nr:hypothetical protein [Austropuccinia psidii MF-1]
MSSKLTEITESSPSAPPPSVLCGSGVFSRLSSPSMASPRHFDPSQTYDSYKAVEVLDPACTECLARGKDCFQHYNPQSSQFYYCFIGKRPCRHTGVQSSKVKRYLWSRKDGLLGKSYQFLRHLHLMELQGIPIVSNLNTLIKIGTYILDVVTGSRQRDVARRTNVGGPIPIGGRPIYSSSEVPISRINTEGVVKRIKRFADSPTDPDPEGSDELNGEEVGVVPHSVGHQSSTSSSQPRSNRFQSQVIPSTPRTFQPVLSSIPTSIPPSSPSSSHARPSLNQAVRPSPNHKPRNSPITTSQQLQLMASSSRRRDGLSPLLFPVTQVSQRRDRWPIQTTREDPNAESENQEAVARLFRRVDRNSREVIIYANDKTILGTASEEMASKFPWYEDELINDFQRTFDDLGRDK